jgi:hypothetical protein
MTDLSYAPIFVHTDWIDNVDRIEAGGPRGLNARLHAIEADLKQASTVVGRINGDINKLLFPAPAAQRLLFTPMLRPGPPNTTPFLADPDGAVLNDPVAVGGLFGVQNLDLPDGATLLTLRMVGLNVGPAVGFSVNLQFARVRVALTAALPQPETLVTLNNTSSGNFDVSQTFPTALNQNVVDRSLFRYLVVLQMGTFGGSLSTEVEIRSLQIDYQTA